MSCDGVLGKSLKKIKKNIYDYVTTSNKQIFMEIACRY